MTTINGILVPKSPEFSFKNLLLCTLTITGVRYTSGKHMNMFFLICFTSYAFCYFKAVHCKHFESMYSFIKPTECTLSNTHK